MLWVCILFAAALLVLPVLLRIYGEDGPRNDDGDSEPALVT
jgi:hypothetical protein